MRLGYISEGIRCLWTHSSVTDTNFISKMFKHQAEYRDRMSSWHIIVNIKKRARPQTFIFLNTNGIMISELTRRYS